jgi:1-acyl-sn-glycerol-3-phosphate acyltransferase
MAAQPYIASTAPHPSRGDAYYWRLFIKGLSFFLFGLSALTLHILALPVIALTSRDPLVRRARVRRALSIAMRAFVSFMSGSKGMTYEFIGAERLGRAGQLIVANHPSLLDVVFLLAFTPSAGCVVKHAMLRNPFTRGAVKLAGYISNDPTHAMIEGASAALAEGQCLIMFPEGTRTTPGQPLKFHRGAANVAVRSAAVVTPVYIECEPPALSKSDAWYRVTATRTRFTLRVGADIDLGEYRAMRSVPLACRALNTRLREYFEGELGRPDEIYCGDSATDR